MRDDLSVEVTPRSGQFAGQLVWTNREGEGIFSLSRDGRVIQHAGTGDAPGHGRRFRSAAHLAAYLRWHYAEI